MKSIKTLYIIAFSGTLIPAWIGNWLLSYSETNVVNDPYVIMGSVFLFAAFWGTSYGFFYLDKIKYGIHSGLGKWLLAVGGTGVFYLTGSVGHPYIIFIGIALVMIWGMADLVMLYVVAKKVNVQKKE